MLLEFIAKHLILLLIAPIVGVGLFGNLQFSIKSIIALCLTWLVTVVLKEITNQPRPYIRHGKKSLLDDPPTDKSFPSGHTSASMNAAVSMFFFNPILGIVLIIASSVVGISRIIVRVHTWYDILIGGFIGAAISIFIHNYL